MNVRSAVLFGGVLLLTAACGPGVYRLQQMLAEIGHSITADGQFGPATEAVVKQYQQGRGALAVNGIVDATLWADLDYQSTA